MIFVDKASIHSVEAVLAWIVRHIHRLVGLHFVGFFVGGGANKLCLISSPVGVYGGAPDEIDFAALKSDTSWQHVVATILLIFLRIN